ncbi:hypothetical protein Celaphus_00019470 [Cervus elaphus hippelaphus]|uniref:Uncharacterized protein n=1 Tax=Cervus elaphus hippelaphus TaxID=46360 RepID=A0A212C3Q0_CEREH|nr:hypothetical protein Celaphus_00019470 [Cervus elaphus hippelaphus]
MDSALDIIVSVNEIWFIASIDLAWMVQRDHLGSEASCFHRWVTFSVSRHIATVDIFERHVLDTEGPLGRPLLEAS